MEIPQLVSREAPFDCIASVILYKNPPEMIEKVVSSFLDTTLNVKLYIIDNSPAPLSPLLQTDPFSTIIPVRIWVTARPTTGAYNGVNRVNISSSSIRMWSYPKAF